MKNSVKVVGAEGGLSPEEREITARWAKEIFGPLELTHRYTWTKGWRYTILVCSGGETVSSLRIIERTALIDGRPTKLGGVAGVMTPPDQRRKGFASLALRETGRIIFGELGAQLGLLLCEADLVPFYSRRGWQLVKCQLQFEQAEGKAIWPESTMILPRPGDKWSPRSIDLCGPPW